MKNHYNSKLFPLIYLCTYHLFISLKYEYKKSYNVEYFQGKAESPTRRKEFVRGQLASNQTATSEILTKNENTVAEDKRIIIIFLPILPNNS